MILKKTYIFTYIFAFVLSFNAFTLPFNSKLSESEKEKLNKGEVIIRNIDYPKHMCLENVNVPTEKIISTIKATKPNYLAEVIQIKPVEGNEDLPEKILYALENIQDYAGIPYWSEYRQKFYDLYSSSTVISKETEGNETKINAVLEMSPFGEIKCPITIEKTEDYIFYQQTNTNNLKFEGITCVRPYCMKSSIILFKDKDNWILYGAGGVNAPRVPFLTGRIETSFINRIKTFCSFIFSKI